MPWRIACALALPAVALGHAFLQGQELNDNAAPKLAVAGTRANDPQECLELINVNVRDHDFSGVAQMACILWPTENYGAFPFQTTQAITDMFQTAFDEGGLWDQTQLKLNRENQEYCMRKEVERITLGVGIDPSSRSSVQKKCPAIVDTAIVDEFFVEPAKQAELADGNWACEEEDSAANNCNCTRRDQLTNAVRPRLSIAGRPATCQMLQQGICYGNCPKGYRPTFFKGWFRPVCSSICVETNHPWACGVGCANSRNSCIKVILKQIAEIVIAVANVIGFLIGNPMIGKAVEMIVRIGEFIIEVMFGVVRIIEGMWRNISRSDNTGGLLLTIFQTIEETGYQLTEDYLTLRDMGKKSVEFWVQLADAQVGWSEINLGWIGGVLTYHGTDIVENIFNVVNVFSYQECELADDSIAFGIEDAGSEFLAGPWSRDGAVNDKPRYRMIADKANVMLEWSGQWRAWSIWHFDPSFGRGWWFWWLGIGWRELYTNTRDTFSFPTTGWMRFEGEYPSPVLVSALNGGEPV